MNTALQSALNAGSMSSLGCKAEKVVDGKRFFNFGNDEWLPPYAELTAEQDRELIYCLMDWNDLFMSDMDDLREVLSKVMR